MWSEVSSETYPVFGGYDPEPMTLNGPIHQDLKLAVGEPSGLEQKGVAMTTIPWVVASHSYIIKQNGDDIYE